MTWQIEGRHAAEFLVSEANGYLSRDAITVAAGADLEAGTVLGKITIGATTVAADAGNTGDGTLTMDATTPVLANAKIGDYAVTCVTAAADGGTFRVEDPNGLVLGDIAVGDTFTDGIKFAIADGATDFIVGDVFTITVAKGPEKYAQIDPSALDGSQKAAAILFGNAAAASADVKAAAITRLAEVISDALVWPESITADQKAVAVADLATAFIITRS